MLKRLWREDEGVLTFEWIMLLTLLVIGVVGGVAAIRDAINAECGQIAQAILSWNPGYQVQGPLAVGVSDGTGSCTSGGIGSSYADSSPLPVGYGRITTVGAGSASTTDTCTLSGTF